MKLLSLLEHLEYNCLQGSTEQEVTSVVYDSRKVEEGSLFICIRGAVADGHKFVPDVIAKGAKTLIVEEPVEAPAEVTVIQVKDTRYAIKKLRAWILEYRPHILGHFIYGIILYIFTVNIGCSGDFSRIKVWNQAIHKTGQCSFSTAASPTQQHTLTFVDCQINIAQSAIL